MTEDNNKPDPAVEQSAKEKFLVARALVPISLPFLTAVTMRMVPRWTYDCPTMGVDKHGRLYLNPHYVNTLSPATLMIGLTGHEAQHVLGEHHDRLSAYRDYYLVNPKTNEEVSLANTAHDLAINSAGHTFVESANAYRRQMGFKDLPFTFPPHALMPNQFKQHNGQPYPNGKISEDYADLLVTNVPRCDKPRPGRGKSGKGSACNGDCGSGGGSEKQPWEDGTEPDPSDPNSGITESEKKVMRHQVAAAIAEQASKMQGTVPAGMRLWAETFLRPPKVDWRKVLRHHIRNSLSITAGRTHLSYAKPNKRYLGSVVFPIRKTRKPEVLVALDTSGSMGPKDYEAAFSEINGVFKQLGLRKVPVFTVDAAVYDVQHVSDVREIKMTGGGGTDMALAIQKAAELKAGLLILITDGFTGYGAKPKGRLKVITCLTRKQTAMPPPWITTVVAE